MAIISVPKPLREILGEDGSDALVNLINQQSDSVKEDIIEIAAEKYERRLSEEMTKVHERITVETGKLDRRITVETGKLNKRITDVATGLEVSISQVQSNLIKWMFIFWIGQFAAMVGIFFAFLS